MAQSEREQQGRALRKGKGATTAEQAAQEHLTAVQSGSMAPLDKNIPIV